MKLSTIIACASAICAFGLFTSAKAEARTHVSFGINVGCAPVVRERVYEPRVYERVYVPCEPVYAAPMYPAPRPIYREVHVIPGYREQVVYPAPGCSYGYWRY